MRSTLFVLWKIYLGRKKLVPTGFSKLNSFRTQFGFSTPSKDIEQRDILRSVCKETYTVNAIRDIVPVFREAMTRAQEGMPGPVFVELPVRDLIQHIFDFFLETFSRC